VRDTPPVPLPPVGKYDLATPQPAGGQLTGPWEVPTAELSTVPPAPSIGTVQSYYPFKIIDSSGTSAAITVLSGFVGEAMTATSSISITDIDTSIALSSNSKIFLKGDVTALSTTALAVTVSSTWTGYPNLIATSGSPAEQTTYYVLIGYVGSVPADPDNAPGFPITISSTDYWVYQRLRTDLMLQTICYAGTPAIYPFAFPGPVV